MRALRARARGEAPPITKRESFRVVYRCAAAAAECPAVELGGVAEENAEPAHGLPNDVVCSLMGPQGRSVRPGAGIGPPFPYEQC